MKKFTLAFLFVLTLLISSCSFKSEMTGTIEFDGATIAPYTISNLTKTFVADDADVLHISSLTIEGLDVNYYAFADITVIHDGLSVVIANNKQLWDSANTIFTDAGDTGELTTYEKLESFEGHPVNGEWTVKINNRDSSSVTFTGCKINLIYR